MRRACIALALLLLPAAILASPAAAKVKPGPKGAAFYTPPAQLKGGHGALVWARKHTGADALKGASRNELLLYRSTDVDGGKIVVSGSLALPKGKPPKGGWPLITYAHGTTGSADACAPSRGYDASDLVSYAYPLLQRWLKAGYAVVRTDYEGLGTPGTHHYLLGTAEGRSVLDAARAARAFAPRKLSKRVVIAGHSQGGHAALYAASLAPGWTPELKVRGTVAFAPASHLATQFQATLAIATPGGGLGAIVGLGIKRRRPRQPGAGRRRVCSRRRPRRSTRRPRASATTRSPSRPRSAGCRSTRSSAPTPTSPGCWPRSGRTTRSTSRSARRCASSRATPTAPCSRPFTDELVADYRRAGVAVTYKTYPGVSHGAIVDKGAKSATAYIKSRLK